MYEKFDKGWDIKLVLVCSSGREVGEEGGIQQKRRLLATISAFFRLLSFSRRPVYHLIELHHSCKKERMLRCLAFNACLLSETA